MYGSLYFNFRSIKEGALLKDTIENVGLPQDCLISEQLFSVWLRKAPLGLGYYEVFTDNTIDKNGFYMIARSYFHWRWQEMPSVQHDSPRCSAIKVNTKSLE